MFPDNTNVQTRLGTPMRPGRPGVYKLWLSAPHEVLCLLLLINFSGNTATLIVYVLPNSALNLQGPSCVGEAENVWSAKIEGFTTWLCTESFSHSWEETDNLIRSKGQMRGEGCPKQCQCGAVRAGPAVK